MRHALIKATLWLLSKLTGGYDPLDGLSAQKRSRINSIIEELEIDFSDRTVPIEELKATFPLTETRKVKTLIWNLLVSEQWKKRISFEDYNTILDVLVNRLVFGHHKHLKSKQRRSK